MEDLKERDEQESITSIQTPGSLVMKKFFKNKLAVLGLVIIGFIFIFCLIGPFFSPYGEYEIFYKDTNGNEISMDVATSSEGSVQKDGLEINLKAPISSKHLLGTDADGRDVFTRLMYGGRISLMFGFWVVMLELLIGVTLGGIAGYYGKWVDMVIMRLVDIFYCIPFLPLMLMMSGVMASMKVPAQKKIYVLMIIMGALKWASVARLVRGQILSIREMEYMQAAKACGLKTSRIIIKHLIPNVTSIIIVMATMDLGSVILTESTLSFLGVGLSFPYASWGNMVNAVNNSVIMKNYINIWLPPGIAILLLVMAFNFIGDGLRDAFDPKMKR
ncbi:ABC transporter permease [uncultured Tyzzerella sp.]|uniref:ABC transporter permease n=1 Tax=uncultured Tyzzerella sp. TaxID=2321398 RepID=UPI002942698F|nr:ABC transporter permease [uncultured Tyzzerella sp.]